MALRDIQPRTSGMGLVMHSNGYEMRDVRDGLFEVTGRGIAATRVQGYTAEEIREEYPNIGANAVRPYISHRYFNARDDPRPPAPSISSPGNLEILYHAYTAATVPSILATFHHWNAIWQASEACVKLRDQITSLNKQQYLYIHKIVAFATGTFHDADPSARYRAHLQFAALLTVRAALVGASSRVWCYAQDPVLTDLDAQFLDALDITTFNDPDGFTASDGNTLVFMLGAHDFLYRKISESAPSWGRPAALVCDALNVTLDTTGRNNEDDGSGLSEKEIQVLEEMFGGYEEVLVLDAAFAVDGGGDGGRGREGDCHVEPFASTAIYWRKPQAV